MTSHSENHESHQQPVEVEVIIVELLDLEQHSKTGKPTPQAHKYRIRIDDAHYETQQHELTGTEILALAGKLPANFTLRQRLHGGKVETVGPEDVVKLNLNGLERFITIPKENTEGEGAIQVSDQLGASTLRRDVLLREADATYLDANHPEWETVLDGQTPYVILNNFPVPAGYNHSKVRAAIILTSGYPIAALDMVYFSPALSRLDGRPIGALADHVICSQQWQRWSRHYSWRAGFDDITIHIERIKSWLDDELRK